MTAEQEAINQVVANFASENANLRIQVEILKFKLEENYKQLELQKKE